MDRSYPQLYGNEFATKAQATLRNRELRFLPIVDEEGKIIGIVDHEDVVRCFSKLMGF